MAIGKNDFAARDVWGDDVYDDIPKSVFALAAYYLADVCSDSPDEHGAAHTRFCEEIQALASNGIMDASQAKRAIATLTKLNTR